MLEAKNQLIRRKRQGSLQLWHLVDDAAKIAGLPSSEIPEVLRRSADKTTCSLGFEIFSESEEGITLEVPFCLLLFNSIDRIHAALVSAFLWKIVTRDLDLTDLSSLDTLMLYERRIRTDLALCSRLEPHFAMSSILKNGALIHLWNEFHESEQFANTIVKAPMFTFNEFRVRFLSDGLHLVDAIGALEKVAQDRKLPSFLDRIRIAGVDVPTCKELALNSSCQNQIMNLSDPLLLGAISSLFQTKSSIGNLSGYPRKDG